MLEFQQVTNIPGNVESTVLNFTNTVSEKRIVNIIIEGTARGEWSVFHNLTKISKLRTSVSRPKLSQEYYSFSLAVNDIIDVKVIHYESTLNDFSCEVTFG